MRKDFAPNLCPAILDYRVGEKENQKVDGHTYIQRRTKNKKKIEDKLIEKRILREQNNEC